jgi:hypothetical protein
MDCVLENVMEFCEKNYVAREIVSVVISLEVKILKHVNKFGLSEIAILSYIFIDVYLHARIPSLSIKKCCLYTL